MTSIQDVRQDYKTILKQLCTTGIDAGSVRLTAVLADITSVDYERFIIGAEVDGTFESIDFKVERSQSLVIRLLLRTAK